MSDLEDSSCINCGNGNLLDRCLDCACSLCRKCLFQCDECFGWFCEECSLLCDDCDDRKCNDCYKYCSKCDKRCGCCECQKN